MQYIKYAQTPLGRILLAANENGLTGLWFAGQVHSERYLEPAHQEKEMPVFEEAKQWLDIYFSGREPDFTPPLCLIGTDFQREVWEILCTIPYGKTMTYGEIAKLVAERHGMETMSAQAVGGAVGRNRLSIVVPCHRVIGAKGNLTGYAGGLERKAALLQLEYRSTSKTDVIEREALCLER